MKNSNNNNQKWFDVLISDNSGKERYIVANESQIDISLNDNYFKRSKNYRDPITSETVKSIEEVKEIFPGDSAKVTDNITMIWNIIEAMLNDCGLDKFARLSNAVVSELYRFNSLLESVIFIAYSTQDEINKQLKYLEFNKDEY